jgi:NAD(P)-dependent dehydrogenase (short-subunit alcohol dehydrogenase family)
MNLLHDRVVLVSGGTQGVGAGIVRAAAGEGATVAFTGRRPDAGDKLTAELASAGAAAAFIQTDLAEPQQAINSVRQTVDRFGRIDCLVNSAGLTTRGSLLDTSVELFDQHMAINLRAPFFTMQTAVADMVHRREPGTIVNIISMAQHGGQPYLSPYAAAKAGLAGLTRNTAFAHRWDKIRINGVNIGWTQTEGEDAIQRQFHGADDSWLDAANSKLPMGKMGQVDEIADFVVFLLSDRSGVVTGSVIDWDQYVPGAHD